MGDFRLNVDVSLCGADGKTRKLDWWVNWWPNKPSELFDALVALARESGLQVDDYYEYQHEREERKDYEETIAHLEQQEGIHHSILDEWGVGRADDGGNVWSIIGRINELGSHKDDLEQQLRWRDVTEELPEHGELVLTYSKLAGASVDYLTTANKFTADHPVESGADVTHWKPITPPEGG